jgi:hypothetical protein
VAMMSVSPAILYFNVHPGSSKTSAVTIANTGTASLSFTASEGTGGSASALAAGRGSLKPGTGSDPELEPQADLAWLTLSPTVGTIQPGSNRDVDVTCDGNVGTGNYTGYVVVEGNDPTNDLVVVPVHLTVSGVYLSNPSPGDTLFVGDSYAIHWSLSEEITSLELKLSTDGGVTFTSIDSGYVEAPFDWVVPEAESDSCVVEITCTTGSGSIRDTSDGLFSITGRVTAGPETVVPAVNVLRQNYPNPFNPRTSIHYSIEEPSHVVLKIYDVTGRLVRTLVDEFQGPTAGGRVVTWDGVDDGGRPVASGTYICRIVAGSFTEGRKMVLLR